MHVSPVCAHCGSGTTAWLDMPVDPMRRCPTKYGHVRRCASCGLGSVWPPPDASEVPAFYEVEDYYTHGADNVAARQSLADRLLGKAAWLLDKGRMFDPHVVARRLPPQARVIDLGCGDAKFLRDFRKLGFGVVGVDPDPDARTAASRHGVVVHDGTAESLPPDLAGRTFDLVIMTHALEHCINPAVALRHCFELLAPGGTLYCEVPNCACAHFETFTICSTMFDAPRHLHFFEPAALRSMMVAAGFMVGEELYWGYARQHSAEWRAWEQEIAKQVRANDPLRRPPRHTLLRSAALMARTGFAGRERKYDSFGIFGRRAPV